MYTNLPGTIYVQFCVGIENERCAACPCKWSSLFSPGARRGDKLYYVSDNARTQGTVDDRLLRKHVSPIDEGTV